MFIAVIIQCLFFLLLSLFQIVHAVVDVYGMTNVISISSPSAGRHYFTFSVFRMSLVSQAKFFFLHDHYSYHKFLFLFSYIPPLYSPVLDIQQVFPFLFFFNRCQFFFCRSIGQWRITFVSLPSD